MSDTSLGPQEPVSLIIDVLKLRDLYPFITLVAATSGMLRSGGDVPVRATHSVGKQVHSCSPHAQGRRAPALVSPLGFRLHMSHMHCACFPSASQSD